MDHGVNEVLGIEKAGDSTLNTPTSSGSGNVVATIILWIGYIEMAAALIISFVYGYQDDGARYYPETEFHAEIFFPILFGGFITGMFFIGFAEVIKLLQKISDNK